MNSSTRSISLFLIGSVVAFGATTLLIGGCNRADEGADWGPDANQNQNQQNQGGYRRGGFVPIPIFIGGGGGGRPGGGTSAPVAAPSARGGFGGTGGGFGGTSAS